MGEEFSIYLTGTGAMKDYEDAGTWRNTTVSGNQTDTITVSGTTGRDNYQYRCVVSDTATLTVN